MAGTLYGLRIAVTRPAEGGAAAAELLAAAGARPVVLPLVSIAPPADDAPLLAAARALDRFDWVVFTSANAVRALHDALPPGGSGRRAGSAVAAVGPATARAVTSLLGWRVDVVPPRQTGGALAAAMLTHAPIRGQRVLWPRAEEAREELPGDLERAGALLEAPVAYRTLPRPDAATQLARLLARRELDAVILTSPAAARALAAAAPDPGPALFCAIGPTTAAAARAAGLPVHVEPQDHTIPALVAALQARLEES